jgi:hypothetical protein
MGWRRSATLALPHRPQPERIGGYLGRKRRAQAAFLGGLGTNCPAAPFWAPSAFSEAWWQFGANDGEPAHYLALAICPDGMRFKKSRVCFRRQCQPERRRARMMNFAAGLFVGVILGVWIAVIFCHWIFALWFWLKVEEPSEQRIGELKHE